MAYSESRKKEAANALMRHMPGLNYNVAYAWVTLEQGINNNILGITTTNPSGCDTSIGGGRYLKCYSSLDAGAAAAASLIKGASMYQDIENSWKSGSDVTQALAIIYSPWHLGSISDKYGSPYYWKGFKRFIDLPFDTKPSKKKRKDDPKDPKPKTPTTPNWVWSFVARTVAAFLAARFNNA